MRVDESSYNLNQCERETYQVSYIKFTPVIWGGLSSLDVTLCEWIVIWQMHSLIQCTSLSKIELIVSDDWCFDWMILIRWWAKCEKMWHENVIS